MLGAIESLLCAVVLDGMTGANAKASNSELIGRGWEYGRAVLWRHHRHRRDARSAAANVRAGATSPISAVIHAITVILALLVLATTLGCRFPRWRRYC